MAATWLPADLATHRVDHWPRVLAAAQSKFPDLAAKMRDWRQQGMALEPRQPDHGEDWLRLKLVRGTIPEAAYAELRKAELVPIQGKLLVVLRAACRERHPWLAPIEAEAAALEKRVQLGHSYLAKLLKGEVIKIGNTGEALTVDGTRNMLIARMKALELVCMTVHEATDAQGWFSRYVHYASAWQNLAATGAGLGRELISHPVTVEEGHTIYLVEQYESDTNEPQYMPADLGRMLAPMTVGE